MARERPSLHSLQDEHLSRTYTTTFNDRPSTRLQDLWRAWRDMVAVGDFFKIGGYHGEPFEVRDLSKIPEEKRKSFEEYWGGYCHHGNVLFPTWHRVYVLELEKALQKHNPHVMIPYWDQTRDLKDGETVVPWCCTDTLVLVDGEMIPNPLRSFTLTEGVDFKDGQPADEKNPYAKPKGYTTVRYPLAGIVVNEESRSDTEEHNWKYQRPSVADALLNENVENWISAQIRREYTQCLSAPTYTLFSNTTSTGHFVEKTNLHVTSLESPHNHIHLAVGGFDTWAALGKRNAIAHASGDMGENNTASLDPIFFFHHANVDRVFWIWQKLHHAKKNTCDVLEVEKDDIGTKIPKGGIAAGYDDYNQHLDMDAPLFPFYKENETGERYPYTSRDVFNCERQLLYTYEPGSLYNAEMGHFTIQPPRKNVLLVKGICRSMFTGSFNIRAFAALGDHKKYDLDTYPVLSRWFAEHCLNCQVHMDVNATFDLTSFMKEYALETHDLEQVVFSIKIDHRAKHALKDIKLIFQVQGKVLQRSLFP